jgi:hypothetical protein
LGRAHTVARKLKAGTIWINCYNLLDPISPFGGYMWSGFGRELGRHSIDLYPQIKSVRAKLIQPARPYCSATQHSQRSSQSARQETGRAQAPE